MLSCEFLLTPHSQSWEIPVFHFGIKSSKANSSFFCQEKRNFLCDSRLLGGGGGGFVSSGRSSQHFGGSPGTYGGEGGKGFLQGGVGGRAYQNNPYGGFGGGAGAYGDGGLSLIHI